MIESDPWLTLSETVGQLGEDGLRTLRRANHDKLVTLHGRRRTRAGLEIEHSPIPDSVLPNFKPDDRLRFDLTTNSLEPNAAAGLSSDSPRRPEELTEQDVRAAMNSFADLEQLLEDEYGWERVQVARREIDALAKSLAGGHYVNNGAETQCRKWLERVMDEFHPISSSILREVAMRTLKHLGNRSFERAWSDASKNAKNGAAWSRPGPRRPPSPDVLDRITALLNS